MDTLFLDTQLPQEEILLQRAILIALDAHRGQYYNIGNNKVEPYIFHVIRTASNVTDNSLSQEENTILKTIAVLHDIVKGTFITIKYLQDLGFPEHITKEIALLTRNKSNSYDEYIQGLEQSERAIRVKLADLKENIGNLDRLPEDRASNLSLKYLPVRQKLQEKLKGITNG